MNKVLVLLFTWLSIGNSFAQERLMGDSLEDELKRIRASRSELGGMASESLDTTEANILFYLSRNYAEIEPDYALGFANQCLELSARIGYQKGLGNAYNSLGTVYFNKGDYMSALKFYKEAFTIRDKIGDKNGLAATYNNIGTIYSNIGNYPEALTNYFTALKMNVESGNRQWQSYNLVNIGLIYSVLKNYPEAMRNYVASLKACKEINDQNGVALCYNSIGEIHTHQHNDVEALKNFFACLRISKTFGYKDLEALSYSNIGGVYDNQKRYTEALTNFFEALKINEKIGYKDGVASAYNFIGIVYTKQKKYTEAKAYLLKGLSLSKAVGKVDNIKYSYDGLYLLAKEQGDFARALDYYQLFINYRDSLMNTVNTTKITQQQMQFDFDKKEGLARAEQDKKDTVVKLVRNILIVGLLLVLLFALVFLRQRIKISKGKQKSDKLLLNILPEYVAEELKANGTIEAKLYNHVTVLFTDFVGFTHISEQLSPTELVAEIHKSFTTFDTIIEQHGLEKIKTIGDAYLAVCGLPHEVTDHAQRVVKAALAIQKYIHESDSKFQIRIGINSGPVVAGIVGVKKYAYDIWGDTVNTSARMEQNSEAGKINISGSTYELIKDEFACEYRGKIKAKNKGEVDMYFVNAPIRKDLD